MSATPINLTAAKIAQFVRELAPHVAKRMSAQLMRDAVAEIERLEEEVARVKRSEYVCPKCGSKKEVV